MGSYSISQLLATSGAALCCAMLRYAALHSALDTKLSIASHGQSQQLPATSPVTHGDPKNMGKTHGIWRAMKKAWPHGITLWEVESFESIISGFP